MYNLSDEQIQSLSKISGQYQDFQIAGKKEIHPQELMKRDYNLHLQEELREINNRYRMGFTEEEAKILQKREKDLKHCYDMIINEWQLISRPCLKFNSEEEGIRYMIKEKMIGLKEKDIVIHRGEEPEEGNIEIVEKS